ncbi:MAG: nucleoside recognition domain-containing protein [Syntrophomonadaceae bacterium]|jgi:Fe2+ transport system protein B
MLEILWEALGGSLISVLQIALIVIPLMVLIEIIKDMNWLSLLSRTLEPLTRWMKLPGEAALPLVAGLVFGISYGAGIIIQAAREGTLDYRDIYMINLFLVICHSVFEDTILFAAIGAIWLPVLLFRLLLAVIVCMVVARFWPAYPEGLFREGQRGVKSMLE